MASRRAGQPVLDYDPLAWLKDEELEPEASPKKSAAKKKAIKKAVSKKSSSKKVATAKAVQKKSTKKKTSAISPKVAEVFVTSVEINEPVENSNAGISEPDQLNPTNQKNGKENMSQETAFGFFTEKPELEDDSFGFFDDPAACLESTNSQAVPVESTCTGDESAISIGTELTIKNVANIKSILDQKLLQSEEIIIELNDLQKIDTAGLQLLFAVNNTLVKTGQQVGWQGSDKLVGQTASFLGLSWPPHADSIESEAAGGDINYGFF